MDSVLRGQNLLDGSLLRWIQEFAGAGVGGDLCGLWPGESALFEVLPNLLTAGAGGVKVLLGVALDLGCAASSRRNLVA